MHAFADFITLISKTSKLLESSNINIVESTDSIKKLKLNLLDFESSGQLICSNSKHLESFLLSIDDSDPHVKTVKFKSAELKTENSVSRRETNTSCKDSAIINFKSLCENASVAIEKRFFGEDGPGSSICVRTAQLLNTAYFPPDTESLEDYGNNEVEEFCNIFGLGADRALIEWKELRLIMSEHFRPSILLNKLLERLLTETFDRFKTVRSIVTIILTIPPSNAEVERVWSSVKNIIDDKSTSMGHEMLESRIQIKRSNVSIEDFDPAPVVNVWWSDSTKSRRPNFNEN